MKKEKVKMLMSQIFKKKNFCYRPILANKNVIFSSDSEFLPIGIKYQYQALVFISMI